MAHEMKPTVVGPPAYTSPDPNTASGRLVPVDSHPFELGSNYGKGVAATSSAALTEHDVVAVSEVELPSEDREEWTKVDWQNKANELGLSDKGNKVEVRARVEDAENDN